MSVAAVLLSLALAQAQPTPATGATVVAAPDATSERAAAAAERAASAAEKAAASAERAAVAIERMATSNGEVAGTTGVAPAQPAAGAWAGSANLSLISLTGNAETLTLSTAVAAERTSGAQRFSGRLGGIYGQSRPADGGDFEVMALAALLHLRADHQFSKVVSAYLGVGAESDHVKSVEFMGFGEAGASITWFENIATGFTRSLLRTDLGLRYARELRFQYYPAPLDRPNVDLLAPRLGVVFRYGLSADVAFHQDLEVLPNILGSSRVLLNSQSKLSSRLTRMLALGGGLGVRHDSAPAPGKRRTDTALTVGLDASF